ncbi:MAG: TIR domain-containing protein [Hyphomicrobiales bacterium]
MFSKIKIFQFRKTILQKFFDWIFGYDLFISYSRIGWSEEYAVKLAEKLSSKPCDFTCFLDANSFERGLSWRVQGRRALRKSKKIILIITPGIIESEGVRDELKYNSKLKTKRKVVSLINIQNAWEEICIDPENTALISLLADRNEKPSESLRYEESDNTRPSANVIDAINKDFDLQKEHTKRTRILSSAVVLLLVFLIIAIITGALAYLGQQEALEQRNAALLTQSRFLSDIAQQKINIEKQPVLGALLSIESLVDKNSNKSIQRERPYWSPAEVMLTDALQHIKERSVFYGHTRNIRALAISDDSNFIISGALDGTTRIWDLKSGKQRLKIDGHHCKDGRKYLNGCQIYAAAISSDGRFIITGANDKTARVWDTKTSTQVTVFKKHIDSVSSIAISTDGAFAVSAGSAYSSPEFWDTTVWIWEIETGKPLTSLKGHSRPVSDLAISPNGEFIVTGSYDSTGRIWNSRTGQLYAVLKGHLGPIHRVAISHDGSFIVTCSSDRTVRVWDARTGKPHKILTGHTEDVYSIVVSPDDKFIVTGSLDASARIWDIQTGTQRAIIEKYSSYKNNIAISPDGKNVYIITGNSISILNSATGKQVALINGNERRPTNLLASPDGEFLVTTSDDYTVRVWDLKTISDKNILFGHSQAIAKVAISPDKNFVMTASWDDTAKVWNVINRTETAKLIGHKSSIRAINVSPQNQSIYTGAGVFDDDKDYSARAWNTKTGKQEKTFIGHTHGINQIATSGDGRFIVTASNDKTARIWNTYDGSLRSVLKGHSGKVTNVTISHDGALIVTGSEDKTARIWNAKTGSLLSVLIGHEHYIKALAISSNDKYIVTASLDKTARIWNVSTGKLHKELRGHNLDLSSVAISRDGKLIATGSEDKTIRIWDMETGNLLRILLGHTDKIKDLVLSSDASFIVSISGSLQGTWDNTARIWDVKTGKNRGIFHGHTKSINSVAIASDDSFIVTGSSDKTARIWGVSKTTQVLVDHAKRIVPRCLTQDQRKNFHLSPEPPRWCITGFGSEIKEKEHRTWKPKWPYHTKTWKTWQIARDKGQKPDFPKNN